jgi:hypothetical protein
MDLEHKMDDYTGSNLSHWNIKQILQKNLEAIPGKHSTASL